MRAGALFSRVRLKDVISLVAVTLLLVVFTRLADGVSEREAVVPIDRWVEVRLLGWMTPTLATVFMVITLLGNEFFIGILTGFLFVIFFWQKEFKLATRLVLATGGGGK
jgi:hypothetical protein